MVPCNSILPRDMNTHMKQISRTVGTPPITISKHLPQVITFQRRILSVQIRELNLQALAQRRENSAATCKVLPSGADLAAPLSSQSYAKPEFMAPQTRHDGKHPDAMIKDFRASLDNTQDSTHRVTIYNGTQEFLKHNSRNKTYILDE